MGKQVKRLSARFVQSVTEAGRHADGDGLYLNVTDSGAKSWVFMWKVGGRRREMGLGPVRDVPLSDARSAAETARKQVRAGVDPITAREHRKAMSFGDAADALIASKSPSWRNDKHRAQWTMTLTTYCQAIRSRPVADVSTEDVLRVLKPLWQTKAETASRLRGRIERVLDFAKAKGMRSGENPARWRGHLDAILPKPQKLARGHHAAMAFDDVPAFMAALSGTEGVSALALQFLILTAARTGEVRGATWREFDFKTNVWTIPANRMKAGREHRVPLSPGAVAILEDMRARATEGQGDDAKPQPDAFVFPGGRIGKPLSVMALEMVLRRAKVDVTTHGFRSAFRDWCGERTTFPREVAEAALAHLVGDDVERAYRRGDALEKRRKLMDAWHRFCAQANSANVVPLTKASRSR
ncbi:tyrosine-type recombinase/integrase [Alsobacter sp. R-9]